MERVEGLRQGKGEDVTKCIVVPSVYTCTYVVNGVTPNPRNTNDSDPLWSS